jgi:hypothetical protein
MAGVDRSAARSDRAIVAEIGLLTAAVVRQLLRADAT